MTERVEAAGLSIAKVLHEFVADEAAPGTGITAIQFWDRFAALVGAFAPRNAALLARRDALQAEIDAFFAGNGAEAASPAEQAPFLARIGYLVPAPEPFAIETANVDPEIATIAAPQLVVPATNARYAINAVNARWGSLLDALITTDALAIADEPARRAAALAQARALLDEAAPLATGNHAEATAYTAVGGALRARTPAGETPLASPAAFVGYAGAAEAPERILLRHHNLHLELRLDPAGAGLADLVIEAAVTAIIDLEDSVATVNAAEKTEVYRVCLGLARGTLDASVTRDGRTIRRELAPDRTYTTPDGAGRLVLPGRALMLVRTVGHHMLTDAVRDPSGAPIPETLLDGAITALIATHDLRGTPRFRNSRAGSAYLVKPKLHGPEEVAFACEMFAAIEDMLALPRHALKMGIMDEERRTSVNLAACLHAARHRVVFVNTGFLDRTGDEIHTALRAGPSLRKVGLERAVFLAAYETGNVATALACGLGGRAQIGKGMWARPDDMAEMLRAKIAQPRAGASTAWVPSPVAATLHALHYHAVDVAAVQQSLTRSLAAPLAGLLTPPILPAGALTAPEIAAELDLNTHAVLGYVARWIDQGIGCSKLPSLAGIGLMEDRATLRISSQLVASWLAHGLVSRADIEGSLRRMAARIDDAAAEDPFHRAMAPGFDTPAFRAATALILGGAGRQGGYTEDVLAPARREVVGGG